MTTVATVRAAQQAGRDVSVVATVGRVSSGAGRFAIVGLAAVLMRVIVGMTVIVVMRVIVVMMRTAGL